jgi:hypothetical protein
VRRVIAILSITSLAACSTPKASYLQPTNEEAMQAIKTSIEAQISGWKMSDPGKPGMIENAIGKPAENVRNYAEAAKAFHDIGELESFKNDLRGLKKIEISSCGWSEIDVEDIKNFEPSPDFKAEYGYKCYFEKFNLSKTGGNQYVYQTIGYFYKNTNSFSYIEIETMHPPRALLAE